MITSLLIITIVLAMLFDFINGFHDAANAIATIVSTRVLTPFQAVLWAAAFNFLAYFVLDDHKIANTVAKTVHEDFITLPVIISGLMAAIGWNLLTWWKGLPSSSSHTLIGGFLGAGMAHAFLLHEDAIAAVNLWAVTLIFSCIFLAPVIGLVISYAIATCINAVVKDTESTQATRWFKGAQLFSAASLSFAHGANDAQKVMGIIYVALVAQNVITTDAAMPGWIPFACYSMIALGTMAGGWRVVKTMALKITRITPLKGVSAETAGALTLLITEHFGIPVSTTQTMAGSIMGAGLTTGFAHVRLDTIKRMLWAWVFTIPVSALLAAFIFALWHAVVP